MEDNEIRIQLIRLLSKTHGFKIEDAVSYILRNNPDKNPRELANTTVTETINLLFNGILNINNGNIHTNMKTDIPYRLKHMNYEYIMEELTGDDIL